MGIDMIAHARSCQVCAHEYEILRAALELYQLPDRVGSTDLVPGIMAQLQYLSPPRRAISMRNWVLSGFIILVSIIIVPMLSDFRALRSVYGAGFTLPLALMFGVLVTLYAGIFVMSHLDDFSRRLKDYQNNQATRVA
jgi:hypothetical protein